MLKDNLSPDAIMELKPEHLADFCEKMLSAKELINEVERDHKLGGRKGLCQYLGIGESTLSGWLREDRIPQAAKEAYVLRRALCVLQGEIRNLRLQQSMRLKTEELTIFKNGEGYDLCIFRKDEDSALVPQIIAENIRDINNARMLSTSINSINMLERTKEHLEWAEDALRNSDEKDVVEVADEIDMLVNDINEQCSFATDYGKWKRDFCVVPLTDKELFEL